MSWCFRVYARDSLMLVRFGRLLVICLVLSFSVPSLILCFSVYLTILELELAMLIPCYKHQSIYLPLSSVVLLIVNVFKVYPQKWNRFEKCLIVIPIKMETPKKLLIAHGTKKPLATIWRLFQHHLIQSSCIQIFQYSVCILGTNCKQMWLWCDMKPQAPLMSCSELFAGLIFDISHSFCFSWVEKLESVGSQLNPAGWNNMTKCRKQPHMFCAQ